MNVNIRNPWVVAGGLAVAATAVTAVALASPVLADQQDAAAEGSLVEDYSYPGAANIPDITLIRGDGRMTMVDCDPADPELITVESIGRTTYCFAAKGGSGWLQLRLDRVFLIGAGGQDVAAEVTANGRTETVQVDEGGIKQVGISDPNFGVLLELRATPAS